MIYIWEKLANNFNMKKGKYMQRTQIYFEPDTLSELKSIAKELNISVSEFIRRVVKVEIKKRKKRSLNNFLKEMKPIESFSNIDATEYIEDIRRNSRIIYE